MSKQLQLLVAGFLCAGVVHCACAEEAAQGDTPTAPKPVEATKGPASTASAGELVAKLASADFDERGSASESLRALGEKARKELEEAAKSGDPEVAHEATVLLRAINRAKVVVKVSDMEGKPVAEVNVNLFIQAGRNGAMRQQFTGKTDDKGTVTLAEVDPGDYQAIYLNTAADGYLPSGDNRSGKLNVGENVSEIKLRHGGLVKAHLTYADKTPIVGVRATVTNRQMADNMRFGKGRGPAMFLGHQPGADLDEKGNVTIKAVPDGEYVLVLYDEEKILFKSAVIKISGDNAVDLGDQLTEIKPGAFEKKEEAKDDKKDAPKEIILQKEAVKDGKKDAEKKDVEKVEKKDAKPEAQPTPVAPAPAK